VPLLAAHQAVHGLLLLRLQLAPRHQPKVLHAWLNAAVANLNQPAALSPAGAQHVLVQVQQQRL
jgi:hypothetical protein